MPMLRDESSAPDPPVERQILDDPDELFDLVDASDRVIGQIRRGEAHRNPTLIHRSVQILVFASDGRLLLQRRSALKDMFPGYYCASASGHVASGEDYQTTAERELVEELGISAPLTWTSKALIHSELETEITALYLAQSDGPYQFHPTETDGGSLFTVAEVLDSMASDTIPMTPALLVAIDEYVRLVRTKPGGLADILAQLG